MVWGGHGVARGSEVAIVRPNGLGWPWCDPWPYCGPGV